MTKEDRDIQRKLKVLRHAEKIGDVAGNIELAGHVPARLIHQHDRVGTGGDSEGYFDQMQRHGLGVAEG